MPSGKGVLRIAIEDFLEGFGFGKRIHDSVKEFINSETDGVIGAIQKVNNASQYPNDEGLNKLLNSLELDNLSPVAQMLVGAGLVIAVITSLGNAVTQPFSMLWSYLVNRVAKPARFDPNTINALRDKDKALFAKYRDDALDAGLDYERLDAMDVATDKELDLGLSVSLFYRNVISFEELKARVEALGIRDNRTEDILKAAEVRPTVQDFVHMADRFALDDQKAELYKRDQLIDPVVFDELKQQGMPEKYVKWYWRAHWQDPAIQQVFEMFQRLRPGSSDVVFDDKALQQYLEIIPLSPYWWDKLTAISYNPVSRVDIRRMYKMNVYNEKQVYEAYRNIGYNDKDAQDLTKFTVAYEAEEESGIVRSAVTSAYSIGNIDRKSAELMLKDGGYDDTTIAFYLNNEDFKNNQQILSIKLANIKERYVSGLIDETNVNTEINRLDLPAERVSALLELWGTERENQITLLSIPQMETLLEDKIVTEDDFKRIAKQRGYTDESIVWTLTRIALEASNKAKDDAEKAQADAERLAKSKTSSQYQKDKSAVDLQIAQAKAEITDIDVALHSDISEEDTLTLNTRKDELKQYIASKNVEKAQLRFDTQSTLNQG